MIFIFLFCQWSVKFILRGHSRNITEGDRGGGEGYRLTRKCHGGEKRGPTV
jgi:hypothetical protein